MEQDGRELFEGGGGPLAPVEVVTVASGVAPGVVPGVVRGVLAGFGSRRRGACQGLRFRRVAAPDIFSGFKGVRDFPVRGASLTLRRWGIGLALSRRSRVRLVVTAAVPRDDDGAKRR